MWTSWIWSSMAQRLSSLFLLSTQPKYWSGTRYSWATWYTCFQCRVCQKAISWFFWWLTCLFWTTGTQWPWSILIWPCLQWFRSSKVSIYIRSQVRSSLLRHLYLISSIKAHWWLQFRCGDKNAKYFLYCSWKLLTILSLISS